MCSYLQLADNGCKQTHLGAASMVVMIAVSVAYITLLLVSWSFQIGCHDRRESDHIGSFLGFVFLVYNPEKLSTTTHGAGQSGCGVTDQRTHKVLLPEPCFWRMVGERRLLVVLLL